LNRVPRRVRFVLFLLFRKEGRKLIGRLLTLALVLLTLSLAFFSFSSIFGRLNPTLFIGSEGTIETVGIRVYSDSSCSKAVNFVRWGTLEPGSKKNFTVYVRNEVDYAVSLFMFPDDWYPFDASNYISLDWDYAGQTVNPQEVIQTTLTLSISPDIEGITNFNFDIVMGVSA